MDQFAVHHKLEMLELLCHHVRLVQRGVAERGKINHVCSIVSTPIYMLWCTSMQERIPHRGTPPTEQQADQPQDAPSMTIRTAQSKTERRRAKSRITQSVDQPPGLAMRGSLLVTKRKDALALERERLSNYISRLPPGLSETDRMRSGQYRSLCRRIFNLRNWNVTRVNLSREGNFMTRPSRLVQDFASLDRAVYPSIGRFTQKIRIQHHVNCARLSAKLFSPAPATLTQVQERWLGLDILTRKTWFVKILLYLLDRKSGCALRFIHALAVDPLLRDQRNGPIADALGHLSRIHRQGLYRVSHSWDKNAEANKKDFLPAFVRVFRLTLAATRDVCSQDLLYNLVGLASLEILRKFSIV